MNRYLMRITNLLRGMGREDIKARRNPNGVSVVHYFPVVVSAMSAISTSHMYIDKVLLMIILCATNAWCSDRMLTRNARTFDSSSFFAWLQALFSNRNNVSIFPKLWPSRPQLQEWTRNGIASLLRLASFNTEEPMHIEFRPEDGPRAANAYQQRFGYRGEWLIKQLGNGFSPNVLLNRRYVPNTFLMPPLEETPFRSSNLIRARSASAFEYNR